MRSVMLPVFVLTSCFLRAQTANDLITELRSINKSVVGKRCGTDSAAAISNRAMNIFLADKTGYLSEPNGLSFYTNYATFNIAEGRFTVSHSFQKAAGVDKPIKKLFSVGFDMTLAGNYTKSFLDKRFEYELGVSVTNTWLGKVKTRFKNCTNVQNRPGQKYLMDALRAAMLKSLEAEIATKETAFSMVLQAIDSTTIPGQNSSAAKSVMQHNFEEDLVSDYEQKFASLQSVLLTKTKSFALVSTHWTTLSAYIPLLFPTYTVAPSFVTPFNNKHPYPLHVKLSHTRMWETSKTGRLFFTLEGGLLFNNAKLSYGLNKLNYSEYKFLGGTDTLHTTDPGNNKLYTGIYKTFMNPSIAARLVYFPPDSHVGISLYAEKNFHDYNLLNCKLGIPIVLINSKKTPAVNIECYVLFFNITNQTNGIGKTSAGLSIGIPFSRLMY